jgi:transposase-like protein
MGTKRTTLSSLARMTEDNLHDLLMVHGVINVLDCLTCHVEMDLEEEDGGPAKFWKCGRCGKRRGKHVKTIFQDGKLSLHSFVVMLYCWSQAYLGKQTAVEADVSRKHVYSFFDKIRQHVWEASQGAGKLGGEGKDVEIDESMFGKKRKYHRGKQGPPGQWVFGGIERGSQQCFMRIVKTRDAATLVPILQEHVQPGTTIYSDGWSAYLNLDQAGFVHGPEHVVNHSTEFASSAGAHINGAEGNWGNAKNYIKSRYGVRRERLEQFLIDHLWQKLHRADPDPFLSLLKDIGRATALKQQ